MNLQYHLVDPDEGVGDSIIEHLRLETLLAFPVFPYGGHEVDGVDGERIWWITTDLSHEKVSSKYCMIRLKKKSHWCCGPSNQ